MLAHLLGLSLQLFALLCCLSAKRGKGEAGLRGLLAYLIGSSLQMAIVATPTCFSCEICIALHRNRAVAMPAHDNTS